MSKKKRKSGGLGKPFVKGDPRICETWVGLQPSEIEKKKRFGWTLVKKALGNESLTSVTDLPGVSLRPKPDVSSSLKIVNSSNDIVDLDLLNTAQAEANKQHHKYVLEVRRPSERPSTLHVPSLKAQKQRNLGFGVSVYYKCSGCRFTSTTFPLYHSTQTGGCETNSQAGAALSKVAIKSSDASFLFASLNLNAPSEVTLQKYFSASCSDAEGMLDDCLAENRGTVSDYMHLVGRVDDPNCPSISVSMDGQFNRPVYHGHDGRSTTLSEPVLENETQMNLMVSHAVVSKLDGSYPVDKVLFRVFFYLIYGLLETRTF